MSASQWQPGPYPSQMDLPFRRRRGIGERGAWACGATAEVSLVQQFCVLQVVWG
eukprot:CAMPEP_0174348968 /NCGR_PEP_ID=MMETSP0811_2-20130205/5600_1 /TAXON_ID=73025 ORGANISM="Eutreptiella gymnastica-like, Strain CCMP1594" /NCGR_SAMPLE_ID=MMETSP0811_2 /ASSEMBLY_ACC=CAM_ASM_000667 /LENGTH=53 /DNA_ID=CAMNT_0015475993 /DNA_START=238 /DNA_END=395 /DNA_ORIENTATION=-